ncbi:MAG: chemotaxis protein CheA [Spirochaetaceae bacterium]|nr:MAG: chemotaxis protein CheA [Spirochaetaceae bacterium]
MSIHADPLETFREEAKEQLVVLEESLLALEEDPADQEMIAAAFRSLHTIKGSGGMFDLGSLVHFAHVVESVFDLMRNGTLHVESRIISLGLQARDHLLALLEHGDDPELQSEGALLEQAFLAYLPEKGDGAASPAAGQSAEAQSERTWRILFRPKPILFRHGANPLLLIREMEELGTILVLGFSDGIPELSSIDPTECYLAWEVLLTTTADEQAIRDVFMFVEDDADLEISLVDEVADSDLPYKRLGEILLERGDITAEALEQSVNERAFLGQTLVEKGFVSSERVHAALEEQRYVRSMRESRQTAESSNAIRVGTDKLSSLVNLVGEFVSMHANVVFTAQQKDDRDFIAVGEQMDRLIRELRDLSIEMHMVPVSGLFNGYRRLVRDLASNLGKEVRLITEGSETELDKNVIDLLKDPLMHIVRNSVDHGIETPEIRTGAGKSPTGTLKLAASYAGAHVVIRVSDDGAGMNVERIRAKAIERGVLSAESDRSEEEILQYIFAPGFSTAEQTTAVSGRGVGMDVVQRNIEQLGGSVRIASRTGEGSTVTIRIPLTLAIVEGLLARVDRNWYLVNLSYIEECLDFDTMDHENRRGYASYRGGIVPFVDMRRYFRIKGTAEKNGGQQLIVVSVDDKRVGLVVDEIQDTYQSVIKSLGRIYEKVEGISGAIMLGNGTPALVLDVDRLVRLAAREKGHE